MTKTKENSISYLGVFIWSLAAAFFLYEFFLRALIGSLAHQIIHDLQLNAQSFAIIGSAYYVTYAAMQLPVGILLDRFGVKFILTFATLVCAGATLLLSNSSGFTGALISRLLLGFGSAFAFVCLLVVASSWFPKKYFGILIGISQFIGTMGPMLAGGPLVSMMKSSNNTWRGTLDFVGVAGLILAVIIFFIVREKSKQRTENDIIHLETNENQMSRLKLLMKNKQAWYIALYTGTTYVSMSLFGAMWGTKYLQVKGLTQEISANIMSLLWLGYAIGCLGHGAISDFTKRRRPILIYCGVFGFISTLSIIFASNHASAFYYTFFFFCLGISASGSSIGFAAITEQVTTATKTIGLSLNNGVSLAFSSFIPPIASFFINLSSGKGHELVAKDFYIGFSIIPLLFIGAIYLSYFLIEETFCKPQKSLRILSTETI